MAKMSNERLEAYLKQLQRIEGKMYKVELKGAKYLLKDANTGKILFKSEYLNDLESFINE